MSKHTPGPWHWINSVTDEPFDFSAPWDGHGRPSLRTVAEFGENKVEVRDGKTYTSWALPKWIADNDGPFDGQEGEANALLIAAAPELLDALRDVISWVPGASSWHTDAPIKAVERARAAIAKAEGNGT